MPVTQRNPWRLAAWAWLAAVALLIILTASHYGDSWDEKVRSDAGELKFEYYQHLLSGDLKTALEITPANDNYPGFHDLSLAVLRRISPFSDTLTGNLFSAALGFLGIVGTVRLGRLLGGEEAGFWAAVLLTLLPAWYGHMFINPKDIPFAVGYIWALGFIYEWISSGKPPPPRLVILCGLAIGAAMAARIGGLLLVCYLGLFAGLVWLVDLGKTIPENRVTVVRGFITQQLSRIAAATTIGCLVLLFFWPAGQTKPFSGASQTLSNVTQYNWTMPVFFEGAFLQAPDLPAYYIIKMIFMKVPLITLLLFSAAAWIYFKHVSDQAKKGWSNYRLSLAHTLVFFAILFPLGYVMFKDSVLYNGLRHLLFVLPPLCALAATAIPVLREQIQQSRPRLLPFAGVSLALGLMLPLVSMIRLHPYQYIYYNELAGGTANAARNYELDYWGTVYKELAEKFYAHLAETRPQFSKPEVVVNMEHVTWLFTPFLPEETNLPIRVVRSRPDLDDYYAASPTWAADQYYAGEPVVEVRRVGARLGVVKDRRGLAKEERVFIGTSYADEVPGTP
jgi:hypothetical protein